MKDVIPELQPLGVLAPVGIGGGEGRFPASFSLCVRMMPFWSIVEQYQIVGRGRLLALV